MSKPATSPVEDTSIPFEDRAFTFDEACTRHLRVSRGTGYKLVKAGQLEIIKLGTRTIVTGAAIRKCREAATVTAT